MDVRQKKILFVLILFASIPACNPSTTTITIGCGVNELIDAINAANENPNHDYIILTESCNYGLGETIFDSVGSEFWGYSYAGLPPITSPITITGNGSRILRPGTPDTPEFRIFYIGPSGSLELSDLYLENGYGEGGAVYINQGKLTLNQCVLKDNRAVGTNGGAIANLSGQVVVTHSTLRNNSAHSGGAIYSHNGSVDIDSYSTLDHNEVTYDGGAIFISGGNLTINGSTIRENEAAAAGGGIYMTAVMAILHDVIIEDNQGGNGGGVDITAGSLLISDSQIRQNQAAGWGGGLFITGGDVSITQGTRIYENLAGEYGGGVCIINDAIVAFEDCIIMDNQAGIAGGGIGTPPGFGPNIYDPTTSMSNCTVSGNSANELGGGIYINSGEWEIIASTISGNRAYEGGGIYNQGLLTMLNSTISMNRGERGGGMLHDSPAVANLSFLTIAENTSISGGGLLIDRTWIHITNSLVARNSPNNCQGSMQPFNPNLDDDGSCGFDIIAAPLLGPLADNGGSTLTHAIPSSSPAVDAVLVCTAMNSSVPVSVDQRGIPRPQGVSCDLGAYESTLLFFSITTPTPSVYWCEDILGVTILEGGMMRIQLSTPGLLAGIYNATVGEYDFTCQTYYDEYPDRLFCDGPKGEGGTMTTLTIYNPLGIPFCEETFSIPARDIPDKPDEQQGCHSGLSQTACIAAGGKWNISTNPPSCDCPP